MGQTDLAMASVADYEIDAASAALRPSRRLNR